MFLLSLVFLVKRTVFYKVFFKYSNWVFVSGMGNASTRKDGLEESEDFDQYMESFADGTYGECSQSLVCSDDVLVCFVVLLKLFQ